MALITRISRLFKADFNAVLDQVEEPELLLKQAIREMEDELTATEQRIRLMAHEQEAIARRTSDLEASIAEADEELDLCFASEKDELARGLIKKKIEGQRLLKRFLAKSDSIATQIGTQSAALEDNRTTLDGLRQKAELFAQRSPSAPAGDSHDIAWLDRQITVSEDDIEIAYLREKDRRVS